MSKPLQSLLLRAHELAQAITEPNIGTVYDLRIANAPEAEVFPVLNLKKAGMAILNELRLNEPCRVEVRRGQANGLISMTLFTPAFNVMPAGYSIWVRESLTAEWYRFAVLKELCQIYCDRITGTPCVAPLISQEIEATLRGQCAAMGDTDTFMLRPGEPGYSSVLAFHMAANMVIPDSHRNTFSELVDGEMSGSPKCTLYDLALIYEMPEFIIRFFTRQILPSYLYGNS